MKKLYTLLGSAALLLGATVAQAQNYQPLYPGHTHHFTDAAQDSIFSLKIDSVYLAGSDTVYRLNDMGRLVNFENSPRCNVQAIRYWIEDNLLGNRMVKKVNGDYLFISSGSDTFTLKTNVPVGQTWNFRNNSSVTASITSKSIEPVATVSDSVITFSLSNGKTIKLSRNYGFVNMHSLRSYYETNTAQDEWSFYSLPEKGIGNATLNALSIYNYQVGDSLGWHKQSFYNPGVLCGESWTRKVILNRTTNTNQDTVWYEVQKSFLLKTYGIGNPPAGMGCPGTAAVHPVVIDTVIEMYTRNSPSIENLTLNKSLNTFGFYRMNKKIYRSNIHNRFISQTDGHSLQYNSCSNSLTTFPDAYSEYNFMEGVGLFHLGMSNIYDYSNEDLEFYRKGTEKYGTYTALRLLASTKKPILASPIKAYPNPVTEAVVLELNAVKSGSATVNIYNLLGQLAYNGSLDLNQGIQQIPLNLKTLPAGVYLLQLEKDKQVESIKLIKQ